MPTLIVAAGGGGDAITGAALAGPLGTSGPAVVMTYSWDRLMVDPLPGPRTAADFHGLNELAPGVVEIVATTRPIPPAGSSLPRLAAELPARLVLLDPTHGTAGLSDQIRATAAYFHLDDIALIDVGGDAITTGSDPGLRSPLADQLALAACVRAGIPARLLIAGSGLDGELDEDVITERLAQLDADALPSLTPADIDQVRHVFHWHPSEASGLLAAAANGRRGLVEVRDAGDQVALADATTAVRAVDAKRAATTTPARLLNECASLGEAEQIIHAATGISEIEYETRKAARRGERRTHVATDGDLDAVNGHAAAARDRGADFISTRRLAELLGATTLDAFAALTELLATSRSDQYEPSLYRTTATP